MRFENFIFIFIHYDKVKLSANPEKISSVIIEPSKMGESNFNNDFNWDYALYLTIHEKCACFSRYSEYVLREKRFIAVSDCDQTNKQEPSFHCINRFMDSESSCDIPWLKKSLKVYFVSQHCTFI